MKNETAIAPPRKTCLVRPDLWRRVSEIAILAAERGGGGRLTGAMFDEVIEAGLPLIEKKYARPKAVAAK